MTTMALAMALLQAGDAIPVNAEMTSFAWIFMLGSMGAVTALTIWCFARVLTTRRHFDPDGTGPAHPPVPGEVDRLR
jgi:hypothetical protein